MCELYGLLRICCINNRNKLFKYIIENNKFTDKSIYFGLFIKACDYDNFELMNYLINYIDHSSIKTINVKYFSDDVIIFLKKLS